MIPSLQKNENPVERALSSAFRRSVDELIRDVETLTDRTQSVQNKDMPAYGGVPRTALRASVKMNLEAVRDALLGAGKLGERDLKSLESRMAQRVGQGVPIQDMIQGSRTSMSIIHDRFIEIATSHGVLADELLDASRRLWALGDALSSHIAIVHQRSRVDDAVRESHLRSEFLRDLLADALHDGDRGVRVSAYGLDPDASYYAVKARPAPGASLEDLRRELSRVRYDTLSAVVGVVGETCIGVLPGLPSISPGKVLAVGPQVRLDSISTSFDVAVRVFAWMDRRGEVGIRQLADVSWRLVVDREPLVDGLLRDRYLAPLAAHGDFGELLKESLIAYLEHDKHIADAAKSLVVHPNTLRYRLTKYQEIAGVDLESLDTLFELSWVLEACRGDAPT